MDNFEENLGKFPYVTLAQVKDYLSISSSQHDGTLTNAISYATAVVEHYIGQEVLANNYYETFNGGRNSVFVARIPLNNVHSVAEYDGTSYVNLDNPTSTGMDVENAGSRNNQTIVNIGNVFKIGRIKKFGTASANFDGSNYLSITAPENFSFFTEPFTIDLQARLSTLAGTHTFITHKTDGSNFWEFKYNQTEGLQFRVIEGGAETINVAHASVAGYTVNTWMHAAVVRSGTDLRLYRDGANVGATATVALNVDIPELTSNVEIGRNPANANLMIGQLDEIRVSRSAQYTGSSFTAPEFQHATDDDTVLLVHCDGSNSDVSFNDVSTTPNQFTFDKSSGKVSRVTGSIGIQGNYPVTKSSYPSLSLGGVRNFNPYANALKIRYNAGYEDGKIPLDLQMATMDYIKIIHKQDQGNKSFSLEGERKTKEPLSGDFPPHIRRVLELYRIVGGDY